MEAAQNNGIAKFKIVLWVFSVFAAILLIGVIGLQPNGYLDTDGLEVWFQLNINSILLFILGVDLLLMFVLYRLIRKLIKETTQLIATVILYGIMCYLFMFLTCKSPIVLINRMGKQTTFEIHGVVMNKLVTANRKRTNHFFYLTVTDTLTTRNFYFNVSDYIYKRTHRAEEINKTFYKGSLGIIYRKEEE